MKTIERKDFYKTLSEIRRTNRVWLHRQKGEVYIPVFDESEEYEAQDITINENGKIEDFGWKCQHTNTGVEIVQAPGGYFQPNEEQAEVCYSCEAVYDNVNEEWQVTA